MRISAIATFVGAIGSLVFIGGCDSGNPFSGQGITNDYRDYVPDSATSVGTGTGSVTFRADKKGTAYVIDWNRSEEQANKLYAPHVLKTAVLLKGQSLTVDGSSQAITVGAIGNTTETVFTNKNLTTDHVYEIRFDTTEHWF